MGMGKNLNITLKAWPVVTGLTIGLCYLTQTVAGLLGIELPDQANLELVRKYMGWNTVFMLLCLQVLVIMPALEELVFRWFLFMLPARIAARRAGRPTTGSLPPNWLGYSTAAVSSALFSAAHYIAQPWPDAAFLALFFFGLAQCWLYARTGKVWCSMLNHALFNLSNLVVLYFLPQS